MAQPGSKGDLDAAGAIRLLGLQPHPEGGHFRETWRADSADGGRAAGTAIYFLLAEGEKSAWHRVDSAEIWHWYAGAPLQLTFAAGGGGIEDHLLGPELTAGQSPQIIVPPNVWQSAESMGKWTLAGCTVSPGFEFEHFESAPAGWQPEKDR